MHILWQVQSVCEGLRGIDQRYSGLIYNMKIEHPHAVNGFMITIQTTTYASYIGIVL